MTGVTYIYPVWLWASSPRLEPMSLPHESWVWSANHMSFEPKPTAGQDLQQGTQLLGIQSCNCQDRFRTLAVLPTALRTDFHHWHLSGSVSHRKLRGSLYNTDSWCLLTVGLFAEGAGAVHEIVERLTGIRDLYKSCWNGNLQQGFHASHIVYALSAAWHNWQQKMFRSFLFFFFPFHCKRLYGKRHLGNNWSCVAFKRLISGVYLHQAQLNCQIHSKRESHVYSCWKSKAVMLVHFVYLVCLLVYFVCFVCLYNLLGWVGEETNTFRILLDKLQIF